MSHLKQDTRTVLKRCVLKDTIPEICDKVYAMGRTIASKVGVRVDKEQPGKKKGNAAGGNLQERKLKKDIKEL